MEVDPFVVTVVYWQMWAISSKHYLLVFSSTSNDLLKESTLRITSLNDGQEELQSAYMYCICAQE